jgi:pimeloyl-ACP methyl ester carboxylesterase
LLVSLAVLVLISPLPGSAHHAVRELQKCPRGSVAGIIGGVRRCLKTGQPCKRSVDRQYHRYGFHCHTGRLTNKAKPKPPAVFRRRIDVGGYRLSISCHGTANPTVILESGSGSPGVTWARTQTKLATTARVCAYDRAGIGDSDPRRPAGAVQAARVVEELHTLLGRAGIAAPYVFGGWSFGGFLVRLYAKHYPNEVLGLVTVDGTPIGLPASSWPNPPGKPNTDLWESPNEFIYIKAADDELAASPGLGARPLIVLVRGQRDGSSDEELLLWNKLQQQVARLSTTSMLVRADNSGHAIQEQAPDLTAEALRQVVTAARAAAPLPACGGSALTRLGGSCLETGN